MSSFARSTVLRGKMTSNGYLSGEHTPYFSRSLNSTSLVSLPPVFSEDQPNESMSTQDTNSDATSSSPRTVTRKLCVRHQRMADEGTSLNLQQV